MKKRFAVASMCVFLLAVGRLSAASPEERAASPVASKSAACPTCAWRARSAFSVLIDEVAQQLAPLPASNLVAAAPLQSDEPAPRGDALLKALVEQLAGRLAPETAFAKAPMGRDEARHAARDKRALSYVQVRIRAGKIALRVDVYPVPHTIWQRARAPKPGPVKHAHSSAVSDAEVRGYLVPLRFETPQVSRYDGVDSGVLAVACGDIDGDGRAEIVTVSRRRILSLRLRGKTMIRSHEARWSELSAVAPVPLREPIGFATIRPATAGQPGWVDVSISDRAQAVRLGHDLDPLARFEGLAVPADSGSVCTRLKGLHLAASSQRCTKSDPVPRVLLSMRGGDALAAAAVVGRGGKVHPLMALRSGGQLRLQGMGEPKTLGRAGAQLAIGDIDLDGIPEVVSTRDVMRPEGDAIDVRSVLPRGTVKRRYHLAVPSGVRALAICPPDGPGRAPVLAITGRALWVLR